VYEESYDSLILSPGAKAIRPNIPGIGSEKIFTLRNIPDTDRIKAYADKKGVKVPLSLAAALSESRWPRI
jgi:NADPH-dependent 2,4-dienoyl-CoA reductase/sulfur reductase-like enzyme